MIRRYTPPQIAAIFNDEARLGRWLEVEVCAAEAWAAAGRIPAGVPGALRQARIDPERIAVLEAEQGHDMAAFVSALQETLGDEGRYLHYGLTSSDVVDTALATQLRDAARLIDADALALEDALVAQSVRHRLTVMPGRTHGAHAEPLTLGVKLANHLDEVRRSRVRLLAAATEVAVGQMSGPVGTHSSVPPEVEERACQSLGLEVAAVSTQVLARDRHAAFVTAAAILGAVLERLATTVRLLQLTEVGELAEPFGDRQKGSSAMPHKRNPILSERICGIARTLRGFAVTALENVALWHERDISHSSAERIILPDTCALLDYALQLSTRVIRGLQVDAGRMLANVDAFGGIVHSQRILNALIDSGWTREHAYRVVQRLATEAREGKGSFRKLVGGDPEVAAVLTPAVLAACFDVAGYLVHIDATYRRLGLDTTPSTGGQQAADGRLALEANLGGGKL